MFYVWLGIVILLIIVELLTTELTTVWFVISGFISLLLIFITDNFLIQFITFVVLGVILLISLKERLKNYLQDKRNDNLLNMKGEVVEEILKRKPGCVKIGRKKYTATSTKKIKVGSTIEIESIDGATLVVKEVKK